ncbi:dTDP-4-dehydrorhamnose 3,5-epimerase [Pseudovibrio japonicus]|uniref:dTDP-4-dehydrorhamnose 3,5-epimerase n=1 Tax=Pseudovibrio japonicus TaxID=366534 RepID=A0ABQ3DUK9_9HYPH|nr:dTDP-4-dehydrorhamnose 3,5-epimerase [Pseudovibrio japonicus]GHB16987.1 dTDP-4-dehydrorhamnose 3,5-epimerase [Pseudovibrio japonicus]
MDISNYGKITTIEKRMDIRRLSIPELIVLTPDRFGDERGFFSETYSKKKFDELIGKPINFVQDNHSYSRDRGVLRGLHFQRAPFEQSKLVRVSRGRVFDVAVDIRRSSPTYGKWAGVELSAEEGNQLFIPKGFLHGFLTLEANTEFQYKVDNPYSPEHDAGVQWNDPDVNIDWPIGAADPILSEKDRKLPRLSAVDNLI